MFFDVLCERMIAQQKLIIDHAEVDRRGRFTAKLKCGDLIKYIRNFDNFNSITVNHKYIIVNIYTTLQYSVI